MTLFKEISSLSKKEKVVHLVLLGCYFMVMEFGLGSSFDSTSKNLVRLNFLMVPLIFYLNAFLLIPKYLKAKKWLLFTLYILVLPSLTDSVRALITVAFFYSGTTSFGRDFLAIFTDDNNLSGAVFIGLILSFAYRFTKDWIKNLTTIEKLKTEKYAAELSFLKSQVDPHFLFNTLNSLYSTALEENSPKTADGITQLGTLMRYNLHHSQAEKISLAKEVEYIQKYILLQKLRTTDLNEVNIKIEIAPSLLDDIVISPMLLIPIIENAFKHGIHPSEHCIINISLSFADGTLQFEVTNTILSVYSAAEKSGIGLQNLKNRLELLYSKKFQLITEKGDKEFLTKLFLEVQ